MMNKPTRQIETRKFAIISTCHATARDNEILCSLPKPVHAYLMPDGYMGPTSFGWWFCNAIQIEDWRLFGLSDELFANLKHLFSQGYDRIELDRDGPVIEGLHQFDW